jgi:hypothetical protein
MLYNILTEFGIPMKLVELIKKFENETYDKTCIGKNLSDTFSIQNGLKQQDAYPHCFRISHLGRTGIEWNIPALGLC